MQVEISLRMLKAGKHVIQDLKLIFTFLILILTLSLSFAWLTNLTNKEKPAAGSKYSGGFILDMGVHFVAGLRMVCSVFLLRYMMTVNLQVLFYTAGGHCQRTFYPFCGVNEELKSFIRDISQANKKITVATLIDIVVFVSSSYALTYLWPGSGAMISKELFSFVWLVKSIFFFFYIAQDGMTSHEPEPRSLYMEGARDVAVLEAMLESSAKQGAAVHVKKLLMKAVS
ncbi:hypothetical protein BHE74_00014227 [Ensete ventricosum]|nr:hypothetical protein BHE74_00014227 [Ensete ventricosum]